MKHLLHEENDDTPQGGTPPATAPAGSPQGDTELRAMQARLAALERHVTTPAPAQPPATGQPVSADELKQRFWQDPIGMTGNALQYVKQQAIQEAVATIQAMNGPTLIESAKKSVRDKDPELFDALQADILANMQLAPENYHTQTQVWQNAFDNAKGKNTEKVYEVMQKKRQPRTPGGSDDGPIGSTPRSHTAPREKELTDDQRYVQTRMRLTPEQYKKGLEFNANQDKGWGEVLTFDSDTARSSRYVERRKRS